MTARPKHISQAEKALAVIKFYEESGRDVSGVEFTTKGFKVEFAGEEQSDATGVDLVNMGQ